MSMNLQNIDVKIIGIGPAPTRQYLTIILQEYVKSCLDSGLWGTIYILFENLHTFK